MKSYRELLLIFGAAATAILLIGAAASGNRAFEAQCQYGLKAVYGMAERYSADNDGYIVRMLEIKYNRGTFWCDKLRVYAKNFRDFSCPANTRHGARAFVEDDLLPPVYNWINVSFGINGHISGLDRRYAAMEKVKNLADPSYTIYFGDSNTMRLRSVGKLWAKDWAPLHDNGMQAVMADGHVVRFKQKDLGTYGKIPGRNEVSGRFYPLDHFRGRCDKIQKRHRHHGR